MSNLQTAQPTLLVTGASGHLGRRVIELLLEAKYPSVVATTRTPEKLADLAARGVSVRYADFDDVASLATAFKGVDRMLLISTDSLDRPGHRIEQHTAAVKAAEAAGIRHIVYTSITNPDVSNPAFVVPDHSGTEAALTASTLGYTSLRNNLYMESLLSGAGLALQLGTLYSAAGTGKAGYVTREDCAIAAAAALASSFEGRRALNITGPESISQADVAAIISKQSGKTIPYVAISAETLIQNMVKAGLPQPLAAAFSTFDVAIAQGKLDVVSTAVEDLSGRKPMKASDFIAANWEHLAAQPITH